MYGHEAEKKGKTWIRMMRRKEGRKDRLIETAGQRTY